MHNSYAATEIWMLLCCRSSACPRHKMKTKAKISSGTEVLQKNRGVSQFLGKVAQHLQQKWTLFRETQPTSKQPSPLPFIGHYVNRFVVQIMLCKELSGSENTTHLWDITATAALDKMLCKGERVVIIFLWRWRADRYSEHTRPGQQPVSLLLDRRFDFFKMHL